MKVFAYEGAWHIDHIVIVGVGGTGSALARLVARLLWARQEAGQSVPTLILIDHDRVERRNVHRQAFAEPEIGAFKSQVIARRYSLAYGLPIHYATEAFDHTKHVPRGALLVDCTDNYLARREIVKGVEGQGGQLLSLGNSFSHGQAVLGACGDRAKLHESIERMATDGENIRMRDGLFRPCYHLPHVGLVYPELLEPEPPREEPDDASCAARLERATQHPLVNESMAGIAAGYIYKLLHRVPITTFKTELDIHNFSTVSTSISPENLRSAICDQHVAC